MFVKVVIAIAVISFLLSLWSLKNLSSKKEIKAAMDKLKKGRVIFYKTKN